MKIKIYPIKSMLHDDNYINEETNKMLDKIKSNLSCLIELATIDDLYDGDLALILVQSGGSENEFLKVYDNLKPPFYLLTYGSNNSLAASLEILSYLRTNKKEAEVLHGDINYICQRITNLSKHLQLPLTNLGVIGKPSDWLIGSSVNYLDVLNKYNINLIDIDILEIINLFNEIDEIKETKYLLNYDKKELNKALKLYKVLDLIKNKYHLDGFTIRCFDLLNTIKTTACMSLALFNSNNIIGTCEGDIPSMISMHLINKLFNISSFQANPCKIDVDNNEIIFAHCTLPLNMTTSYTLDTHFESNSGVAVRGKLKEERVTIFKLSNNLVDFVALEGTIIKNLEEDNLCRTQIKIKLDDNINYFLTNPYGNHHIIFYGEHKNEIMKFFDK